MKKLFLLLALLMSAGIAHAQTFVPVVNGVATINAQADSAFTVFLNANATLAITNPQGGKQISILFQENSTGGFTLAYPSYVSGGPSIATAASAQTQTEFTYNASVNTWFSIGGGGSSSPAFNPQLFGNQFYGLAPQQCGNATCTTPGAKGDTHIYFDVGMTSNNHVTSGSPHFAATDVGKWFESCASSCTNVPITNLGTITAFNSSTDVTVSVTAGTTYANARFAFGTDDDAAMQNWATNMTQAPTLGVAPSVRGGYLPSGGYAIKQPLQIKYPGCATQGTCNQGEGGMNSGGTGTLRPSLWIAGQGTASTFIYVRNAATFTWPTQALNIAAFYVKDFDFSSVTNFAVIADTSIQAITGVTAPGLAAGVMNDNSTHAMWSGLWIQGFHAAANMCGFVNSANDFESTYSYMAVENNDFDACVGDSRAGTTVTLEKITFNGDYFENALTNQALLIGSQFGNSILNLKQIAFNNCHALNSNATAASSTTPVVHIIAANSVNGDTVQFVGFRMNSPAGAEGNDQGFQIDSGSAINIDFHGSYLEDTLGSTSTKILLNNSATAVLNFYGGGLWCTNCTNAFTNAGNAFIYGTKLGGTITSANLHSGAGNTYGFFPISGANGGWNGQGSIQDTVLASNQGTAFSNASAVPGAGWGTGATGTVCATRTGFTNTACFLITSGSAAFGAAPTVTVTLPNPLPTTATPCTLDVTAITGAGGAIMFDETTVSATAPVFTATTNTGAAFTPAVTETYRVVLRCGP